METRASSSLSSLPGAGTRVATRETEPWRKYDRKKGTCVDPRTQSSRNPDESGIRLARRLMRGAETIPPQFRARERERERDIRVRGSQLGPRVKRRLSASERNIGRAISRG